MKNKSKVDFLRRQWIKRKEPIIMGGSGNDLVAEATHVLDIPHIVGNDTGLEIRMPAFRIKACDAICENKTILLKDNAISLSGGCYV